MKKLGFLALALLAACDDSTAPAPADTPSIPITSPTCPTPTGTTTHHAGAIAADETWTAESGPHEVDGIVRVLEGHTLTIAPCATVRVSGKDAGFEVAFPGATQNGTLIAEGTDARPITFEGGHFMVRAPGLVRLAHVTMQNATIEGTNGPVLKVDHVTMTGGGITLSQGAAFASASDALTIKGAPGEPLQIGETAIDSIPRGTYSGNATDAIRLDFDGPLATNATMKTLGVPYVMSGELRVGTSQPNDPLAVLTIEAGAELRFPKGGALSIEHAQGAFPATGALVVKGSASQPVVMRSAEASPSAGDWRGLWFGGIASSANRIEHLRVEHAGASCGCILQGCSAIGSSNGAIIFTQKPPSAFITDTLIAHGKGSGFVLGYVGEDVDFVAPNQFQDLEGCSATLPGSPTCPQPRPMCR
jgi:hypothetical protein